MLRIYDYLDKNSNGVIRLSSSEIEINSLEEQADSRDINNNL